MTARVTGNREQTQARKGATMTDRYLDVKQVADLLGTTERFPRRLIEERRIEFVRIGRHVRIAESVLNAYIEAFSSCGGFVVL